jgi:hypothetical protein
MAMKPKMRTKLPIVNPATGEIFDVIAYVYGEDKPKDTGFIKVFHVFTKAVLADKDIMRGAFRLLLYIMTEKLETNKLSFYMTEKEVIEKLDISRATYYTWLKTLLTKEYIVRLGTNLYTLKPYTAIIGRMADVESEID